MDGGLEPWAVQPLPLDLPRTCSLTLAFQEPWRPTVAIAHFFLPFLGGNWVRGGEGHMLSVQLVEASHLPLIQGFCSSQQGWLQSGGSTHMPWIRTAALGKRRLTSQSHARNLHFYFALSPTNFVAGPGVGLSMDDA